MVHQIDPGRVPPPLAPSLAAGLGAYQQALWGLPARLVLWDAHDAHDARAGQAPVLTGGPAGLPGTTPTLHLPWAAPAPPRRWAEAVVSHAAAHQRFGAVPQPRAGLKPVQQALYGVLEDARVEALACAELPGLRGLWQAFHGGPDALQGLGFEALLARLARVLLDPAWRDPHPWVDKVRRGVQGPDGGGLLLATPASLLQAASVLGHDIGQMRLPFNPRTYRPHPAYRDDNQHLWCWDPELPPSDLPLRGEAAQSRDPQLDLQAPPSLQAAAPRPVEPASPPTGAGAWHPEWDQRIGRYRPAWCCVRVEPALPRGPALAGAPAPPALRAALARLPGPRQRAPGCAAEGEVLHPAALVEAALDLRRGQPPDPRLYQRQRVQGAPLAVSLLLDMSASTAEPGPGGLPLLAALRPSVAHTLAALQALGHRQAAWAFSSRGRLQVTLQGLKDWNESALAPEVQARLAGLQSGGSTRLGAVLRQALQAQLADAARHPGWRRVMVLLTDGELRDIDVHEAGYLQADLARACREAARQGVAVRALVLPPGRPQALHPCLGAGACAELGGPTQLAWRLPSLLGTGW